MAVALPDADRVGALARAGLHHVAFQREADRLLRAAVAYDMATWATVDPASLLLSGCTPVGEQPFHTEHRAAIFDIEYLEADPLTIRSLMRRGRDAAALRRDVADPSGTRRHRELLAPFGIADELVAVLAVDGNCWGAIRAFRREGAEPFSDEDVDVVASVSRSLAEGLRLAFLRAATVEPAGVDDPPGALTVDPGGRIVACTPQAEPWLAGLGGERGARPLLASLAAGVAVHDQASAVVAGSRGPVALHASHLAPDGDHLAIIIIERPRPVELTPRVMEAYGLTPRESDVTGLVLRGATTAQIARAMGVSTYTVQDHLKSIFAKVGVQTRGELAHAIHTRFYLPPADAGATPGPYGYFLGL